MRSPLTQGDAHDLLETYKRSWERRDPDLAMSLYREDAEHRSDPFEPPLVGSTAIREMWDDIALNETNIEFDTERVWVVGDTIMAAFHAAYSDRTNGDRVRLRGMMLLELDGQRLIRRAQEWTLHRIVGRDTTISVSSN